MSSLVAAIDCGTTTIKAAIFDLSGRVKGIAVRTCPYGFFKDGRIEQDPQVIVKQAFSCMKEAVHRSRIHPKNIASVSISSQRATVICVDKEGEAISSAISWQDMRGVRAIESLRKKIRDKDYYNITGLPNNPVFSLGKILCVKNTPLFQKTARFSLIHDYLLKNFGAKDLFLDWSNASLTGMFDIEKFDWSNEILKLAGIPRGKLPLLVRSGKVIGAVSSQASKRCGLLEGTPLVSGGGDQQCAGIGAGAVKAGIAEFTLGTAGVLLSYSDRIRKDPKMRVTCCAHAVPGAWEVEGLQNAAGGSLDWAKKIIFGNKLFSPDFFRKIAAIRPGAEHIFYYPFLAGASAPNWNPQAQAMLLGLTYGHDNASIARAVMEGVSMETKEILDVFDSLRIPIQEIRLTGGGSKVAVWNQMQADIYGKKVSTLRNPEASLLGAAMLAAYGVGAYKSLQGAADKMVKTDATYRPAANNARAYEKMQGRYRQIYDIFDKSGGFKIISRGMGQ